MKQLTRMISLALCTSAAGTLAAPADPASADSATIRVRPHRAEAGEVVTVRGRGWAWGEAGDVYWGTDFELELAAFETDDRGRFRIQVVIPDVAPGRYEVAAIGESTEMVHDTVIVTASCATSSRRAPELRPAA